MIDTDGFRPNVGIVLADSRGGVLWARRVGQSSWQFPQRGIQEGEGPEQALFWELKEEVGLNPEQVDIVGCTRGWLRYRLPKRLVRRDSKPLCVGQKQKWFLLKMLADDNCIRLDGGDKPEFDTWNWVSYWYPLSQIVQFKREVYRRAMKELAPRHTKLVSTGHAKP